MALERRYILVARTDGSVSEYPLSPKVEIAFEKYFKVGIQRALQSDADSSTNLYRLAWLAQKESGIGGVIPGEVETWAEDVVAIDVKTEAIRPTVATPQAAGSQS